MNWTRCAVVLAIGLLGLPSGAEAQRMTLDLDETKLAAKAIETVEVTLDGPLLDLAARFLNTAEPDERQVAELVRGLEGIYVRSYKFAEEAAYDLKAVERFRGPIGAGWQRIVSVRRTGEEDVQIYTHMKGDLIDGLIVIAAEPKELTFVNIVGPIDLAQLSALEGQFGIPRIPLDSKENEK